MKTLYKLSKLYKDTFYILKYNNNIFFILFHIVYFYHYKILKQYLHAY